MQTAKQLSVSLVNKPGRLAVMLAALSKEKVNFRALSVMDSGDRGTVRFVPDDSVKAGHVLDELNPLSTGRRSRGRNTLVRLLTRRINVAAATSGRWNSSFAVGPSLVWPRRARKVAKSVPNSTVSPPRNNQKAISLLRPSSVAFSGSCGNLSFTGSACEVVMF